MNKISACFCGLLFQGNLCFGLISADLLKFVSIEEFLHFFLGQFPGPLVLPVIEAFLELLLSDPEVIDQGFEGTEDLLKSELFPAKLGKPGMILDLLDSVEP